MFADLDWDHVAGAISARCLSRDAAELAADLGVLPDAPTAERRRREVDQACAAWRRGAHPPLRGVDALGDVLVRARKADAVRGEELVRVARGADAAGKCAAWARTAAQLDLVVEHCRRLSDVREVAVEIQRCVDPVGYVVDGASPELAGLRHRVTRVREGIVQRLERIVRSPRYEGILQDDYVTVRDERYVVPVRAGEKGDFPGIVHGQSASGQTLFIEPHELVEANNQLRIAQLDVENEVRRILVHLTDLVRRRADDLESNHDVLTYLDLTFAAGRLASDLECTVPELSATGDIFVRSARHPVLALRALNGEVDVVANELVLDRPGLIISGPNTGGKTVTLKMVGLFALMTRAGLPLPIAAGGRFPYFDAVFSDIGDDQGVDRDLSTFSGHVANIASFLPACGRGALVLLDELFAGTDPEQGAALGRALLLHLVDRGACVIVTTHLESLKTLGFAGDRFASASVAFDIERMRPSYVLRSGVPGASYALRIAERIGLDRAIVRAAEALLEDTTSVEREAIIQRLEAQSTTLSTAREEFERATLELARRTEELESQRKRLARADRELVDGDAKRLQDELKQLRSRVNDAAQLLRDARRPTSADEEGVLARALESARRAVSDAQRFGQPKLAEHDLLAAPLEGPPREGDTVWVRTLRRTGVVVALDGARAVVHVGALRTNVALEDLMAPPSGGSPERGGRLMVAVDVARDAETRLDLRGERADDALERLDAFVERASRGPVSWLTVVHGHGTGALKRLVRKHLDALSTRVAWRPGETGEGGDGVTIVTFT